MSESSGRISDDEIIEEFRTAEDPVLTAVEIAEKLGVSRVTANNRLKDLDTLKRKKVGGRAVVWWLSSSC
jgi:predicted DNA-binding transcriptional regulator AlpA